MSLKYKRILLKLSGEALKSDDEIYDKHALESVSQQIIELSKQGLEIGVVIGGGNIWRGKLGLDLGLPQIEGDYMGMMATYMNGLALAGTLNRLGFPKVEVYASLELKTVTVSYNFKEARQKLKEGYVLIFVGGTGFSYFTTDTASTIRAIEIGADALLMAKNGVAGVYESDPKHNPQAKMFKELTHKEVADKNLRVMDLTAATLAKDANLQIEVFDMQGENNIVKVMNNQLESTIIK
ncbi:uridylate kinase [Williamsoniiplasma luminosum]|uniref:Uridylate kinase n=1 Tax=Williamsoniiplasma luminosum TaxID=214888 RepID=A0A2K8NUN1_9MOLU|nr:UMP kinase [Williamsoniiplasma luminosum]ATZ17474.1 uridylate kinase [Williamsoniiplasma luminosum]